jgi:DNA-damage-inducible protein J
MYLGGEAMPTTEMVHVRIDKRVKAKATKTLSAMGLSVSDAVRVLLTRVAAEKALPFEIKVPNATTVAAMREARTEKLTAFDTASDLIADLNADD